MKELHGLKVKAIACEVPEGAAFGIDIQQHAGGDFSILAIVQQNKNTGTISHIQLPPGSWKILGRANELDFENIELLIGIQPGCGVKWFFNEWQSFYSEHGLTNELILIEQ